jgi:hypothetical protein
MKFSQYLVRSGKIFVQLTAYLSAAECHSLCVVVMACPGVDNRAVAVHCLLFLIVQAYLWDDNRAVVEWLTNQLEADQWETSVLCENIKCVQRDQVLREMKS